MINVASDYIFITNDDYYHDYGQAMPRPGLGSRQAVAGLTQEAGGQKSWECGAWTTLQVT